MFDRDTLYRLYVVEGKTTKEIAAIAGVRTPKSICDWMDKYGIPRRDLSEAQRPVQTTKEELYNLYVTQDMRIDLIGKHLGISEQRVSRLLKEYGIPINNKTRNLRKQQRPSTKIELTCPHCGQSFFRDPSRLTYGRGKYCSSECQYAAIKAKPKKGLLSLTCIGCGAGFQRQERNLHSRKGAGKYCSRACRDTHRVGHLHPQYLGTPTEKRGPNWQAQRRKALKRDNYTCQHCANPADNVHHIMPFRYFGMKRYKEANDLGNLISLCESCHRIADAAIQRAEQQQSA